MATDAEVEREVLQVMAGTSDRYVPAPKKDAVLSDLFIALKRFSNAVRWKEFFLLNRTKKPDENSDDDSEDDNDPGFSTNLRPQRRTYAPRGTPAVESFLKDVERTLLSDVESHFAQPKRYVAKNAEISQMTKLLGRSSLVAIPTDKTNSFRCIQVKDYNRWVSQHLDEQALISSNARIQTIYEDSLELLDQLDGDISEREYKFLE